MMNCSSFRVQRSSLSVSLEARDEICTRNLCRTGTARALVCATRAEGRGRGVRRARAAVEIACGKRESNPRRGHGKPALSTG